MLGKAVGPAAALLCCPLYATFPGLDCFALAQTSLPCWLLGFQELTSAPWHMGLKPSNHLHLLRKTDSVPHSYDTGEDLCATYCGLSPAQ